MILALPYQEYELSVCLSLALIYKDPDPAWQK